MPQETHNKNKAAGILFWVLTIICMGIIFYFSSQTSYRSAGQSHFVIQLIRKVLFFADPSSFVVRKAAHFLEYTGLCLFLNCALLFSFGNRKIPTAILCASLYAVTDEVHQLFVEGRSCEFRDWLIDTSGAVTGALVFLLIYIISDNIIKKRRETQ